MSVGDLRVPDDHEPESAHGQSPFGVTQLLTLPTEVAVVVGTGPPPALFSALERIDVTAVELSVAEAESTLQDLGPFAFLVLGPSIFANDAGIDRVRGWHRHSPSARVKLLVPTGVADPQVLVRAVRAGVTDVVDSDDDVAIEASLRAGWARALATREQVLAIGAHPDDIEIGCGGTLLDHRRRGDRVSLLTLSQGAVGGDQSARLHEAIRTASVIGAALFVADLPDTRLDPGIETIRLIESVVAQVRPSVVYVHSLHDSHQDHRAVSTASRSATRSVRRVFAYQSPSATEEFSPTQFVNIDAVLSGKVSILKMFRSQDGRSYLEPDLVIAGARYWARHLSASARYAEPFEVIRSVGELRHAASAPSFGSDTHAGLTGSIWSADTVTGQAS